MKKNTFIIFLLCISITSNIFAQSPPLNDNPTGATTLTIGADYETNVIVSNNDNATDSENFDNTIPNPGCATYEGSDVWFNVIIPDNGNIIIETQTEFSVNSIFDSGLAIYSGEIGNFNLIDCDDDSGVGQFGFIALTNQIPGDTLFIRVWENGTFGNIEGTFEISAYSFESPINDDPINATSLTVGSDFQSNTNVALINEFTSNSEDFDSTIQDPGCANYEGQDIWYTITVPDSGSIAIETQYDNSLGGITNSGIAVYSNEIGNLNLIDCDDSGGSSSFSMIRLSNQTPGEQLFIRVWENGANDLGTFFIAAYDFTPPTNDDPINAIPLTIGPDFETNAIITTNEFATDSEIFNPSIPNPNCANYNGQDVWYSIIVPDNMNVTIETQSNNSGDIRNTGLAIYSGEIGNLNLINCDDSDGLSSFSKINLSNQIPGEQLYIRVWENGGNREGNFLIAAHTFTSPINDDPIDAITLTIGSDFETNATITTNEFATDSEIFDTSILNPGCADYDGQDIWYSVIVPNNGNITIETQSNNHTINNTGIAIYSGEVGNLNLINCDDFDGIGSFSMISLTNQTPGQQLYIRTWSEGNDDQGSFLISAYTFVSPINDDPIGAITLTIGPDFETNATIANNMFATDSEIFDPSISDPECANYSGRDIWYSITIPDNGNITIETQSDNDLTSITNTGMAIYSGTIGNLNLIECDNSDGLNSFSIITLTNQTPGQQFYIRAWENGDNVQSTFLISARTFNTPINDDPIDAISLTIGSDFETNAIIANNMFANDSEDFDATIIDPECASYNGQDIWYTITIPDNGNIIIETQSTNNDSNNIFNTGIAVYSGEIGDLNLIECDDFDDANSFSLIKLTNQTPSEKFYIRAWEDGGNLQGSFLIASYTFEKPINDDPIGAIDLTVGTSYETSATIDVSNEFATNSEDFDTTIPSPGCGSYNGQDIWFTATVPDNGNILIDTQYNNNDENTIFDTAIAVYSGEVGNLNLIDCRSFIITNSNEFSISQIALSNQTPGEQFYIRVWEDGGNDQGTFRITSYTYVPPTNDDPIGAIPLTVGTSSEINAITTNNQFATASEILNPSIPNPECASYNGGDIWHTVTVPDNGNIIIETQSSNNFISNTGLAVYSGDIENLNLIECNDFDGYSSFSLITLTNQTPGEQFYIRAWEDGGNLQGSFLITAYTFSPPVNDDPINSIPLIVGPNFQTNAIIANNEFANNSEDFDTTIPTPTCAFYRGQDIWYTATVPDNGNITIETKFNNDAINSILDTGIAIYSGTIGNLNLIECDDFDGDNSFSKISLVNQIPGNKFYIRAWEDGGNSQGSFLISAHTFDPPTNDNPINAVNLIVGTDFEKNAIITSNELATDSEDFDNTIINPSCANYNGQDVWYTATVPDNGNIIIETKFNNNNNNVNSILDTGIAIYSGTIANLNLIRCDDFDGDNSFSKISLVNQIPGNKFYIRAWENGGNSQGSFLISAHTLDPPTNDNPINAVNLIVGTDFEINAVITSNELATNSEDFDNTIINPGCASYNGQDVWHLITVPNSGNVTIETQSNGDFIDTGLAIYSGGIGDLTLIMCNDDSKDFYSSISLTNQNPGSLLYIRTWSFGNTTQGTYLISAYNDDKDVLSTDNLFLNKEINYYPNPIVDYLTISSQSSIIDNLLLFSINGREILVEQEIAPGIAKINMTNLSSGIYFVRITINNKTEVLEVIKK